VSRAPCAQESGRTCAPEENLGADRPTTPSRGRKGATYPAITVALNQLSEGSVRRAPRNSSPLPVLGRCGTQAKKPGSSEGEVGNDCRGFEVSSHGRCLAPTNTVRNACPCAALHKETARLVSSATLLHADFRPVSGDLFFCAATSAFMRRTCRLFFAERPCQLIVQRSDQIG
jgi:hypothetical protein